MFARFHIFSTTEQSEEGPIIHLSKCISLHEPTLPVHSSMEVGVCAEAYQGGEPTRHINSAFMTFEVLDSDRKPRTLPRIRPEPVVSFFFIALYPKIDWTE